MWANLHTHSYFSLLRGMAAPLELAQAAAAQNMPALGLTDSGLLSGAIEFYDACRGVGVKPILGLELPVQAPFDNSAAPALPSYKKDPLQSKTAGKLVFLAENLTGWSNLCELSSLAQTGGSTAILIEQLAQYSQGLICLTGGRRGFGAALLEEGADRAIDLFKNLNLLFPNRLYAEFQIWSSPFYSDDLRWCTNLLRLAKQLEIPSLASVDIHYLQPEGAALQRVITAIRLNTPIEKLSAQDCALPGSNLISEAEARVCLQQLPIDQPGKLLEATIEIAQRCQVDLPLGVRHYPAIDLPGNQDPDQELRRRAIALGSELYGDRFGDILPRLEDELGVIATSGYSALFLIMQEILDFARRDGVPFSSRGSAASSLVAHCLGITSPDPVELNLYFERFLNPMRATPPDIDTDLCSRRRDRVINFVYERFGQDRVAMVATINRFRTRSALREVAKAHGLSTDQIQKLLQKLPQRWYGPSGREANPGAVPVSNPVSSPAVSPSLETGPVPDPGEIQTPDPAIYQAAVPDSARASNQAVPYAELSSQFSGPLYEAIFANAAALRGIPDHLSIHPGGVVIAPGRMAELVPVQMAPKGILITQFDLASIERLGMLKIDLLGIRGLTVLGDVAEGILSSGGAMPGDQPAAAEQSLDVKNSVVAGNSPVSEQTPGDNNRHQGYFLNSQTSQAERSILNILEAIPETDSLTSETLQAGRTIGCFQIESPGMRATLREIEARSIGDLTVALALYRPGPLTGGLKEAFVERFKAQAHPQLNRRAARERVDKEYFLHPSLKTVLAETYGVILYQEQVLRIAHELAGFSLADADLLRRAMSHFDLDKQMQSLKTKFIAGSWQRSQVPEATAGKIWDLMAAFAGYGFPKAHAASYAVVAWRAAWCKTNFPALFMAAVLANWGGYYSQQVYLNEARRMGLKVRPPHVNYSGAEFKTVYLDGEAVLFMGLGQVRDLTQRSIQRIVSQQPFRSFQDFLSRVDPRPGEARNLVRVGALEGFGSQPGLLRWLEKGAWQAGQLALFEESLLFDPSGDQEWSLVERVQAQDALLGASLAAHPLELVERQIRATGAISSVEAAAHRGHQVRMVGMRQSWRRSRADHEQAIYTMVLEDMEGILDVLIPGEVYKKYRKEFSGPGPYLVEGMLNLNPNTAEPFIRASRVQKLVY